LQGCLFLLWIGGVVFSQKMFIFFFPTPPFGEISKGMLEDIFLLLIFSDDEVRE
jgi:hypothetical protein